jgi:hypothetical protein
MIIKELHERYFFMVKILYIQRYKYQWNIFFPGNQDNLLLVSDTNGYTTTD